MHKHDIKYEGYAMPVTTQMNSAIEYNVIEIIHVSTSQSGITFC